MPLPDFATESVYSEPLYRTGAVPVRALLKRIALGTRLHTEANRLHTSGILSVRFMRVLYAVCFFMVLFRGLPALAQGPNECPDELFPFQDKTTRLWGYSTFLGEKKVPPTFIKARPFQGRYAVVLIGTKYGVIDCEGKTVLEAVYDAMGPFIVGRGWAQRNELWGLIDVKGRVLQPFQFQEMREVSLRGPLTWLRKNEKWGLYNKDWGRLAVQPVYDTYAQLSDSAAIVRLQNRYGILRVQTGETALDSCDEILKMDNRHLRFRRKNKWGIVDHRGNLLQPAVWDSVGYNNGMAVIGRGKLLGLCSMKGLVVAMPFADSIAPFSEGKAAVRKGGLFGYFSNQGRELTGYLYTQAGPVLHNMAVVSVKSKYGLLNMTNRSFLISPAYANLLRYPGTDLLFAKSDKGFQQVGTDGKPLSTDFSDTLYMQDSTGFMRFSKPQQARYYDAISHKFPIPGPFQEAGPFIKGLAEVKVQGVRGLINYQGAALLNPEWDSIEVFTEGTRTLCRVRKAGKYGLYGTGNKAIVQPEFEELALAGPRIKVKKHGKWGLLNPDGSHALKPDFSFMSTRDNRPSWPDFPALVQHKQECGLIDPDGNYLLKPAQGTLYYLGINLFAYKGPSGKTALYNAQGKALTQADYDSIAPYSDKVAGVLQNGKWGFINASGIVLTAPRFEAVTPFEGRAAYVKENGKWGAWDKGGKFLLPAEYSGYVSVPGGGRHLVK